MTCRCKLGRRRRLVYRPCVFGRRPCVVGSGGRCIYTYINNSLSSTRDRGRRRHNVTGKWVLPTCVPRPTGASSMHRRRLRRTPMRLFRCVCQRKPTVAEIRHGAAYGRRAARRAHSVPGPPCPFDRDLLRRRSLDPTSRHRRILQVSSRWSGQ